MRRRASSLLAVLLLAVISACASDVSRETLMKPKNLDKFAADYTAAWCKHHADSVAAFFAETGSLQINDGAPAVGREAITASAQGFMTAFPDLVVKLDKLVVNDTNIEYHWTLTGQNTGPSGTGRYVRVSGFEIWRFGPNNLIAESKGHFNESDYNRQLAVERP